MTDQEIDEPNRPTARPFQGFATPPGSMAIDQAEASRLSAHINARLLEQNARQLEQGLEKFEQAALVLSEAKDLEFETQQSEAKLAQSRPGDNYQVLKDEHQAFKAQAAEQIKADHGVRLASEFHQRGLSDGVLIDSAINAFAKHSAESGLDSLQVGAMDPTQYENSIGTAMHEAQIGSQKSVDEQKAEFAATASEITGSRRPPEAPSNDFGPGSPPLDNGPDRGPDGGPPTPQHEWEAQNVAQQEPNDITASRAALYERLDLSTQNPMTEDRSTSAVMRDEFEKAGHEITDSREALYARIEEYSTADHGATTDRGLENQAARQDNSPSL